VLVYFNKYKNLLKNQLFLKNIKFNQVYMSESNNINNLDKNSQEYQEKLKRIKKQVAEVKDFYIHLMVYLVVNFSLVLVYFFSTENIENVGFWPIWPILGWGIGIIFHALSVFVFDGEVFAKWEDQEIAKRMKE
jgi:2TM domain